MFPGIDKRSLVLEGPRVLALARAREQAGQAGQAGQAQASNIVTCLTITRRS